MKLLFHALLMLLSTGVFAQNNELKFENKLVDVQKSFALYDHQPTNEEEAKQMLARLVEDNARFTFMQYMVIYLWHYDAKQPRRVSDKKELHWEEKGMKIKDKTEKFVAAVQGKYPGSAAYYEEQRLQNLQNIASNTVSENIERLKSLMQHLNKKQLNNIQYEDALGYLCEAHTYALFYGKLQDLEKDKKPSAQQQEFQKQLIAATRLFLKKYPKK